MALLFESLVCGEGELFVAHSVERFGSGGADCSLMGIQKPLERLGATVG
jgi:hypothetical protein